MKAITCEMCGSHDFVKQDGVFICQGCGMKYSLEDAKKMMSEGAVEVQGTVTVQNMVQTESLLKLAQSSFESKNYSQAENFCNQVIAIDDKNYEAWKLKGEAINYQISVKNPRILEVYNCIMTSYRVLDNEGKEKNKADILSSIKICFEGEIDFWLEQIEKQRPSKDVVNKAKSTFNDAIAKIESSYLEMGFDSIEKYKKKLKNYFISQVNAICVSVWKTTVGYNYYRDSFETNNHALDPESTWQKITWKGDDYRPDAEILTTFIDECDNLINLLLFAGSLFNDETANKEIITTYENAIFLNTHVIGGESYVRMVSTTTNGYGAVTDRREYWKADKDLTSDAKKIRVEKNKQYKQKIRERIPEYQKKEDDKKELEENISYLYSEIYRIDEEKKKRTSCLGVGAFLVGIGILMLIVCISLSMPTAWVYLLCIALIVIGLIYFVKAPSREDVKYGDARRKELLKKITELKKNLDSLK